MYSVCSKGPSGEWEEASQENVSNLRPVGWGPVWKGEAPGASSMMDTLVNK